MKSTSGNSRMVNVFSRQELEDLKVGSEIINAFGKEAVVTEIFARGENRFGKLYVCLYAEEKSRPGSKMSETIIESEGSMAFSFN